METAVNRSRAARRKRNPQACNRCRFRKQRCDGLKPTCSACSEKGQPCSYEHAGTTKRGLPAGYVRSLELLWALVFAVVPNSTNIVEDLLQDIQFTVDSRGKLAIVTRLIRDPDLLRKTWEGCGLRTRLDGLLSGAVTNSNDGESPAGSHGMQKPTTDREKHSTEPCEAFKKHSSPLLTLNLRDGLESCSPGASSINSLPNSSHKSETPARLSAINNSRSPQSSACSISNNSNFSAGLPVNCRYFLPNTDFNMNLRSTATNHTESVAGGLEKAAPNPENPYLHLTRSGDSNSFQSEDQTLGYEVYNAHMAEGHMFSGRDDRSLDGEPMYAYGEAMFGELFDLIDIGETESSTFEF